MKEVVGHLLLHLIRVLSLPEINSGPAKGEVHEHINLIEGQPVFHLAFESVE